MYTLHTYIYSGFWGPWYYQPVLVHEMNHKYAASSSKMRGSLSTKKIVRQTWPDCWLSIIIYYNDPWNMKQPSTIVMIRQFILTVPFKRGMISSSFTMLNHQQPRFIRIFNHDHIIAHG